MGMIQFVANYDDLSSDKGYQFKFYCDKCRNGYMSKFSTSKVGMAGTVLRTAGSIFGGWMSSAGYGAYDLQRMVGGPEHDAALREAMEEGKKYFHQCTRCGKWVCPEVCWNQHTNMCEECSPDLKEELASAQAVAKAEAARQQMYEKASKVDYTAGINMEADSYLKAPETAPRPPSTPSCAHCGSDVESAKFCPQCGKPVTPPKQKLACGQCGYRLEGNAKFCPECGGKMSPVG